MREDSCFEYGLYFAPAYEGVKSAYPDASEVELEVYTHKDVQLIANRALYWIFQNANRTGKPEHSRLEKRIKALLLISRTATERIQEIAEKK